MSSERYNFPEFFTTKGPIYTNVTPLKFGNSTYWMSSLASEESEQIPHNNYMKPYEDNEEGLLECGDIEENYDIVLTKSGKFMTSFYVPSNLLSYIVGAKGSKLKSLQRSTNTLIKVPKPNEKGDVKITGDTERKVASARTQVSMIVFQRKDKLPVSHFVSIKMFSDAVESKFNAFKRDVLKDPPRGVTESIFQNPRRLHLTISTLTLVDEEEVNKAKTILKECHEKVVSNMFSKTKSYRIVLEGLEIMNDDPSEVNVLYGNVKLDDPSENRKLQDVADKIADYFYMSGLTKRQYDRVKLHVTLMNTGFRGAEEKKMNFDATDILENYKGFYFGVVDFDSIHLSVRFTEDEVGYYESAGTLKI